MRYAIPSPYDEEMLSLMGALSGVTEEELRSEYNKASQELRLLGKPVELYNIRKIPQYGMVRLGYRIIFFFRILTSRTALRVDQPLSSMRIANLGSAS